MRPCDLPYSAFVICYAIIMLGACWITEASQSKCGEDDHGAPLICCDEDTGYWEWVQTAQAIRNCQEVTFNEIGAQGCNPEGGEVHAKKQEYKCGGLGGCSAVTDGGEILLEPGCPSASLYGADCPDPSSGGGGV